MRRLVEVWARIFDDIDDNQTWVFKENAIRIAIDEVLPVAFKFNIGGVWVCAMTEKCMWVMEMKIFW